MFSTFQVLVLAAALFGSSLSSAQTPPKKEDNCPQGMAFSWSFGESTDGYYQYVCISEKKQPPTNLGAATRACKAIEFKGWRADVCTVMERHLATCESNRSRGYHPVQLADRTDELEWTSTKYGDFEYELLKEDCAENREVISTLYWGSTNAAYRCCLSTWSR